MCPPNTEEELGQLCQVPLGPPPHCQPPPRAAGQEHLHTLHPEGLPGPVAVLRPAQGLPVFMPGDVGLGGALGIAVELQGGARGQ